MIVQVLILLVDPGRLSCSAIKNITILHQDKKRHYLKHIRNYIFIIFARIQVCYIFRIIFLNVSINIHTQCFGNMICTMVTVSPLDVCHWFTNIWLLEFVSMLSLYFISIPQVLFWIMNNNGMVI